MEITYRLTRDDYRRFQRLVCARLNERACGWCRSPPVIVAVSLAVLAILGVIHRLFRDVIGDAGLIAAALAYVAGLLSTLLLFWVLQRRYLRDFLGDDSTLLAESHLRLDSGGIEATAAHATTRYAWHGIREVTEAAGLVVVWIDRARGIVVPKRVFASDKACRSFVDTVRAHLPQSATAGSS